MLNIRLSVLALTLVGFAVTLLSGCSSTPADPTAAWAPEKIYSEARDEMAAGAWDRAAMLFDKLEGRAAGTPLAQQAQIEKAYAQYRATEKIQALATLDRFLKLHPASPAVDYALYLKGLVNFNDNLGLFSFLTKQDLSERDQKAAKDSFESFKELIARFPDSKYAADARQRMTTSSILWLLMKYTSRVFITAKALMWQLSIALNWPSPTTLASQRSKRPWKFWPCPTVHWAWKN